MVLTGLRATLTCGPWGAGDQVLDIWRRIAMEPVSIEWVREVVCANRSAASRLTEVTAPKALKRQRVQSAA